METDILIAGFGGQGVLFAGEVLCKAALASGLETSWFPSYGPEMRGGTAHCTVIISGEPVAAPIVRHPGSVIALNLPSFLKFEPVARPGAVVIANSTLIEERSQRDDIEAMYVPATRIAEELGDPRIANVVAVGVLAARLGVLRRKELEEAVKERLAGKDPELIQINVRALETGFEFGAKQSGVSK